MNNNREIFRKAFIYREGKSALESNNGNHIVYETDRDFIIIHSVVGDLDVIITMAENLSKRLKMPLAFQGRTGWQKVLEGRSGWTTEMNCLGTFQNVEE